MGWRSLALVMAMCALGCGPVVDGDAEESSSSDPSTTTPTPTTDDPSDPTVVDEATTDTPSVLDVAAPEQNVSGVYLMAVSAVIDPQHPLQWIADVAHDTSTGTLTITAQSLSLDVGSTNFPREPIGDPIVLHAGLEDGRFGIETPEITVVGAANPITGSDIVASLVIQGQVFGRELWCGDVFGEVSQPLQVDLTGSTFAFEPIPPDGTLPDPVLYRCPD